MNETNKVTFYSAFGLKILSELFLPGLNRISHVGSDEDLMIRKEDLSSQWLELVRADSNYYIKGMFCMFKVPGVAIYKIENGRHISFSPLEGLDDNQIQLFLLGTCMGVVLMQRNVLPIHGSCIAINGNAYVFVGDSGAGKSTLASAFINRGYQLLTDDVAAVTLSKDNIPYVTPSYPQQKLWQESLDQFGIASNQFKSIYAREAKFAIPVNEHFTDKPMPLAGVFELTKVDQNDIEITSIQDLERFPLLYYHTYRNFMIHRSGLMEWHFDISAKLVNRFDIHRIIRPISRFTADEIVDHILNIINKVEKEDTLYQKGEKVI